jgi:hypothetical protein
MSKAPEINNPVGTYLTIDGEKIFFNITLINKKENIPLPIDNFIELIIEEDLNSPFYKGVLRVKNDKNRFDLQAVPTTQKNFNFIETGENFITIEINKNNISKLYVFFIVEETTSVENGEKVKNIYIEDAYLYRLRNDRSLFSTTNLLQGDVTQLSDNDRQVNVSDAIQNLLQTSFDGNNITEDLWAKSSNKTNFTSNLKQSRLEALDFLLDKAIDTNSNSLFLFKRNNSFELRSINDLFVDNLAAKIKNNFGGNFTLVNEQMQSEQMPQVLSTKVTDFTVYNENSLHTLEQLLNHKVIRYDFNSKKFDFFNSDNTIDNTLNHIKDKFLNKRTTVNRESNDRVSKNILYKIIYTTNSDVDSSRYEGRNIILKNLISLSTMLSYKCKGIYNIAPGQFINTFYNTAIPNKHSKKLNGSWMVVGYKHTFTINTFYSEIACTKFHELIEDI